MTRSIRATRIDLGIYCLPFLARDEAHTAITGCIARLEQREAFLLERLAWCGERGLTLPALAFERPLLALQAELAWLRRLEQNLPEVDDHEQWDAYVDLDPPDVDA